MRVTMRMPSKKQYNLVTNDELDTRVPLHPDEAFTHGIKFSAKYIGTLDVPRPTSRVEIVAAMRRIRYEFKAKGIKKKKTSIEISVEGVKVSIRKKKKQQITDESQLIILNHPVYRIFYVSHDSQDLKIFSYIARDASSNVFRCHVFKANKKNQAMRVVRTVGQAFEVCHKMSVKDSPETRLDDRISREGSVESSDKPKKDELDSESGHEDLMTLTSDTFNEDENAPCRNPKIEPLTAPVGSEILRKTLGETISSPLCDPLPMGDFLAQAGTPLSVHHELQLLREQLEQQQQQTQAAVAQVHLLRDQLAAETAARLEAQARTHQLLVHNKDLLEHIQQLVMQVRNLELNIHGGPTSSLPTPGEVKSAERSPRLSQPETPPTPSPTMGSRAFMFPPNLLSSLLSPDDVLFPRQDSPSMMARQLQEQRFQHQLRQRDAALHVLSLQQQNEGSCSTMSMSSDSDAKSGAAHSSGESITTQLYGMDRLPRVPEDSVPLMPQGSPFNGPITRAASERYSRQETLAQLQRMAWARHTTK